VEIESAKEVIEKYWEHEPVDQGVAEIASLDATIV
jgi:hypothetical protein